MSLFFNKIPNSKANSHCCEYNKLNYCDKTHTCDRFSLTTTILEDSFSANSLFSTSRLYVCSDSSFKEDMMLEMRSTRFRD